MEKLSAKCISCITYISAGEKWGKLSDMNDAGFTCDRFGRDNFVRYAHHAPDGLGHNDQPMNIGRQKTNDCAYGARSVLDIR